MCGIGRYLVKDRIHFKQSISLLFIMHTLNGLYHNFEFYIYPFRDHFPTGL